ncbi:MAG: magnesium transporter [Erysipelotrichaceae bacterium]
MIFEKDELQAIIAHKDVVRLREIFDEYNIVDLSELVMELDLSETLFIFKTLKKDVTAEIFTYLPPEIKEDLVLAFTGPEIQVILHNLYSDDMLEFIEEMPANLVKYILKKATPSQRSEINLLLSYKENSAGSIMSTDFITLKGMDTVATALAKVRKIGRKAENNMHSFVTGPNKELLGSLTLRDLLFVDDTLLIEDIMDTDLVVVHTQDDQEEVVKTFEKYDTTVVPVVNDQHRLIGIITADDILDVIHEEATEDMQKMAAITPLEDGYLQTSVWAMSKSRVVWMLILMITATITQAIMAGYDSVIQAQTILSAFIPMLMDTSGNAGSQAATMVIRALAMGEVTTNDMLKIWRKEASVAILCGGAMGLVNFLRILIFMNKVDITTSMVVSLTVFIVVLLSKIVGSTLPVIAVKLKQDPAIMAGPLITTLVDAISLFVYFQLAVRFLM